MIFRATGILIEDGKILVIEQDVNSKFNSRNYSLPGGTLEEGETIKDCLIREMKEETGLIVEPTRFLYLCDRIIDKKHVVHMTFELKRVGGKMMEQGTMMDSKPIHSVKMIPIEKLQEYGFTKKFHNIVKENFPNSGTYCGFIENIGL